MFNRKLLAAGVACAGLIVGCSTEQGPSVNQTCPAPATTVSSSQGTFTPHLGAGDSLGHQIFGQDRVASVPSTAGSSAASISQ